MRSTDISDKAGTEGIEWRCKSGGSVCTEISLD